MNANAKLQQYLMDGTAVVITIGKTDFDFDLRYDAAADVLHIIPTVEVAGQEESAGDGTTNDEQTYRHGTDRGDGERETGLDSEASREVGSAAAGQPDAAG